MPHSYTKLFIHIVFHVKSNRILILDQHAEHLYAYMGSILKTDGCIPIKINGMPDHIHILCTMPSTITLAKLVENVKRYSCRWIKTKDPYYEYFAWQVGYGAFSVSASVKPRTIKYIENQREHHKIINYHDEYYRFVEEYGVDNGD